MSPVTASHTIKVSSSLQHWLFKQNDVEQRTGRQRVGIGYVEDRNGYIWQSIQLPKSGLAKNIFFELAGELASTSDQLQHIETLDDKEDLSWETPDFMMSWKNGVKHGS